MPRALKRLARKNGFLYVFYHLPRLLRGYFPIFLDYPVHAAPRWGHGRPPHPQLAARLAERADVYRETLRGFLAYEPQLLRIAVRQPRASPQPSWQNNWFEGLDTLALYGFVAQRRPALHLEVGSGYSTKVVRRAIRDHALPTRLVSIDPHPRAEIDALCDEVIRQPVEEVALERFDALGPGDILFLDSSHRIFQNSDVAALFLDVLPRLRPGVLIHVHDIFLPDDYPPGFAERYYSEQYVLATMLLAGPGEFDILLPNHYAGSTGEIAGVLAGFWSRPEMKDVDRHGASFWMVKRAR